MDVLVNNVKGKDDFDELSQRTVQLMDNADDPQVQKVLKDIFGWCSRCKCCERHIRARPDIINGANTPWEKKTDDHKNNPLKSANKCFCCCRHISRNIFCVLLPMSLDYKFLLENKIVKRNSLRPKL